jgi:Ca2+-binding RTX toxin-like protein
MAKPSRKRRSARTNALTFSALEDRKLLAALIEFDAATKVISIEGTSARDEVIVNYADGYAAIQVTASDSTSQNTARFASWEVSEIHFNGNAGNDLFRNNSHRTSIVDGGVGNDELVGGWGNDSITGRSGNDRIIGRFGADVLHGGSGADVVHGGTGNDQLEGWAGNDTLSGGAGADTISGWFGNDIIFGGDGDDVIDGSSGDDFLGAGNGDDTVDAGEGNDILRGGFGSDDLDGGLGNDKVRGDQNNDLLKGSAGIDFVFGNDGDDELHGGEGNDRLFGGTGDDLLIGDDGNDTLYGESGVDTLKGHDGNDGLYGGLGEMDRLEGGKGADRLLSKVDSDNRLEELILGWSSDDAVIRFEDLQQSTIDIDGIGDVTFTAKTWTDSEIRTIDLALGVLHQRVGNTNLLKTHTGVSLRLQRAGDLIGGAFEIGGWNTSGVIALTNSAFRNDLRALAVTYHEVGHNWDQAHENSLMPNFESISRWRNSFAPGYTLSSGGNNWHYQDTASGFARSYGTFSPNEDYATTWETYFTSKYHGTNGWQGTDNVVPAKFSNLDALFATQV